jgi:hypothetical protein
MNIPVSFEAKYPMLLVILCSPASIKSSPFILDLKVKQFFCIEILPPWPNNFVKKPSHPPLPRPNPTRQIQSLPHKNSLEHRHPRVGLEPPGVAPRCSPPPGAVGRRRLPPPGASRRPSPPPGTTCYGVVLALLSKEIDESSSCTSCSNLRNWISQKLKEGSAIIIGNLCNPSEDIRPCVESADALCHQKLVSYRYRVVLEQSFILCFMHFINNLVNQLTVHKFLSTGYLFSCNRSSGG